MPDSLRVEPVNFEELRLALDESPLLTYQFAKQALGRFAKHVRKVLIRERMSGRPGIVGGAFKRGKNVQGFVYGTELSRLKSINKISRILRTHEEGGTIAGAPWLAIRLQKGLPPDPRKVKGLFKIPGKPVLAIAEGKFIRALYLLRRQVVIPARLGFEALWRREVPEGVRKVEDAVRRSVRVSVERRMKHVNDVVRRLVA